MNLKRKEQFSHFDKTWIERGDVSNTMTVFDMDSVLLEMDTIYGTNFMSSVKSQANFKYTMSFLKRMTKEFSSSHFVSVVSWITEDWESLPTYSLMLSLTHIWRADIRQLVLFVKGLLVTNRFKSCAADLLAQVVQQLYPFSTQYQHSFLLLLMHNWERKQVLNTLRQLKQRGVITPDMAMSASNGLAQVARNNSRKRRSLSADLSQTLRQKRCRVGEVTYF
jgi:hypothetical protein